LPEWLIERGIGETRAALVDDGAIVEARIGLEGATPAGTVLAARLTVTGESWRNAVATASDGTEYLLPSAPATVTEGTALNIEVIREAIPGSEPWKRPLARATSEPPSAARSLGGREIAFTSPGRNELDEAGWDDLIEQARTGLVEFGGGALRIALTRAMALIDVDGGLAPAELAVAGAAQAARAIRRLDIGGSIGIDLPTVAGKASRQAAAAAIDEHLPQPFERTAVNGFGLMQIIRRRDRPSLIEQVRFDPVATDAALLLRHAERAVGTGPLALTARDGVIDHIAAHPAWIDALQNRTGRTVRLVADPAVKGAGHAQ
jgi:hypothetical protein